MNALGRLKTRVKALHQRHPVASRAGVGALVGYFLVSPLLMILSDRVHRILDFAETQHMRDSVMVSFLEVFQLNFIVWTAIFTALTALVGAFGGFLFLSRVARAAAEEDTRKFKTMADHANYGMSMFDLEGKLTYVNEHFATMHGYRSEELLGQHVRMVHAEQHGTGVEELLGQLRKTGSIALEEVWHLHKDGSAFPTLMTGTVTEHAEGEHSFVAATAMNITERKQAEEALRESELQIRLLLDSTAESILGVDVRGDCTFCNPACLQVCGCENPDLLMGQSMHLLIHGRPLDGEHCGEVAGCEVYQALRRGEQFHSEEMVLWRSDGTSFPAEFWLHPVRRNGEVTGAVITFFNITRRKHAEDALRSSHEQLRNLAARLQAVREEERTMIARELHDELGQALAALRWDLYSMSDGLPEHLVRQREQASAMLDEIDAAADSVRDLSSRLRPPLLDDLGLVAAIEWQAQQFTDRTRVPCQLDLPEEELSLETDRATAIFRVLQEALTNVARHANAKHVHIRVEVTDWELSMVVGDDGRGISEAELNSAQSLGVIGMRERALALAGQVGLCRSADGGTTVTLRMPLQNGAVDEVPSREDARDRPPGELTVGSVK